jgi:two-component system LytT family sensor kinase
VQLALQIQYRSAIKAQSILGRVQARVLFFLGFTALGLFNFEYRYFDDLARRHQGTFAMRIFEEMTGVYIALALFSPLIWLLRRYRIRRDSWLSMLCVNVLILCGFSACDTTLMGLSRTVLAPWFGLGLYDYGLMQYRYPMEFAKHVPIFLITAGAVYVIDSYREARDLQVASADLAARLSEAQLQNLRLQLQPHFLFNALNTVSSIMHEDVEKADAVLADLGELLRLTLRASHVHEVALKRNF